LPYISAAASPFHMVVSGYAIWVKEHRPAIAEELKRDASFLEKNQKEQLGAVAKAVGQRWTELDVEVKTRYESIAAAENEKIREERTLAHVAAAENATMREERDRVDATQALKQAEVQVRSSASTGSGLKPLEETRLEELQAMKQKAIASIQDSVQDWQVVARELFLQDVVERAKMATEVLGEETIMAKMGEHWSNMTDEQRKDWEGRVQAEKLHAWEQTPEGFDLKMISKKRQIEASARAQARWIASVSATRVSGRGQGRARGRGRGQGKAATSKPVEMPTMTPSKRRLSETLSAESASTPQGEVSKAESAATPQKLAAPQHEEEATDTGLDEESLKRARRKGLEASLVCLAQRSEIKALHLSGSKLFEAIRKSGGLVNAAKNNFLTERQTTSQGMPAVETLA